MKLCDKCIHKKVCYKKLELKTVFDTECEYYLHSSQNEDNQITTGDLRIEDLDFSVRTYNSLKRVGINTVQDIIEKTSDDFRKIRSFGERQLSEVVDKIRKYGYVLKEGDE